MVLPPLLAEDPPRFLVAAGGFWRDMGTATKYVDLSKLQQMIDEQLKADMAALDPQVNAPIAVGNYNALLYDPLIPEPLQRLLKTVQPDNAGDPPPLLRMHLDPSLEWIPWEVAHDGNDYLGLRFRIARLPIVRPGKELPPAKDPWPVARIYNFLGEFVLDPALHAIWAKTFPIEGQAASARHDSPVRARPSHASATSSKPRSMPASSTLPVTAGSPTPAPRAAASGR